MAAPGISLFPFLSPSLCYASAIGIMFFVEYAGSLWWTCEQGIGLRSTCVQRSIIDVINSVFLIIFYALLVIHSSAGKKRKGWIITVISACCVFTSTGYFFIGFLENGGISNINWWSSVIRGLVWISLAVSVILEHSKTIMFFLSVWWSLFFFLSSALNIEVLIQTHRIDMIELVSWVMNLLLFSASILNFICSEDDLDMEKGFSEPFLEEEDEQVTELCRAGFFSRLAFSWINPLLVLGYSKSLALEDVPFLAPEDEASVVYQRFADSWELIRRGKAYRSSVSFIVQALVNVHYKDIVFEAICAFIRTVSVSTSPLLLYSFVNYANTVQKNWHQGFMLVSCLVLLKVVESLSQRHLFFCSRRSGMRMRSSLMVAIYQKLLKLSNGGRSRHSTGEIMNYIAVDAYRMGEFHWWFHLMWSLVLQLFLSVGVLFLIVGIGAITGLVPLLVCGFLNLPFAKIIKDCQFRFMEAQDERLRATSEILNNMKVIKLQSWEDRFKSLVESLRQNEFTWLAKAQYAKAYGTLLFWSSPTLVSSVIFIGCLLFNSTPLNASTIFAVLAALRSMGEPVRFIPEALSIMIQAKVSFDRLNAFFLEDEIHNEGIRRCPSYHAESVIGITGGNFSWDQNLYTPTLKYVDLHVIRGQKIAICGSVGSGKSSFLYAILGEIPKLSGMVDVFGSMAYVSQSAWIQSGTVRDNILFGKTMDETRYEEVIRACALDKDIQNFKHGDLTEIGQRGLNMSGGQKQRIQLARSVYNNADIYLLDDPFSAVDAHTAATLFHDCVLSALKDKTVILVTHQVEFLSEVDKILVMEGGKVTQSGTYEELLMDGERFKSLVNAHKDVITACDYSNDFHPSGSGEINAEWVQMPADSKYEIEGREILGKASQRVQLTAEEEMEVGDVGWISFLDYVLTFKGLNLLCSSLSSMLCFILLQAAASYWLALATGINGIRTATLIGVYSAISTLSACFVYLRSFFAAKMGLKGSSTFFSAFNNAVFSAPMLFFDSTPVGRILTRASSDLSLVDFDIPFFIVFVLGTSMELVATLLVMASVTWQILFVAIIAMILSKFLQDYYLASAKQLIRINGTTKAPVMNYATETSLGVATIRAFNMMDSFSKNNMKLVNTDAKLFFHSNAAMEWLVLRVEALQNLTLLAASLLLMLLPPKSSSPGLVGLSLSYALALNGTQVFIVRSFCNLSNFIVSAERIKQFMNIPSEPPAIVEHHRPPPSWPFIGRIELHDLKVRYNPNAPLVLKGITCTFEEGTRVGVVGRTGSGKTTLITSLFRLVEPHSGTISIDGIDICSIGLKDLRMKLSIIPQEPTLFRGSVRTNLDPLGVFSDDEIWKALEKCQLKQTICSLPRLLDSMVTDEGENWSAGQRQLFGLGRVLLRRNRILVLDEATASIDSATDAMLQRIIREEFHGCTVITVAHRVPTVIDSDMVMVLSYGELVEYDEPSNLMQLDSAFSRLVAEYWASCRRNLRNQVA